MARSNPGFHSVRIGEITVTAMNDGQFEAGTGLLVGMGGAEAEALLADSFRALPPRITVSCFLIEMPGHTAVVDFGGGGGAFPVLGHAHERLAALGVAPSDVDTVLLTHGHSDHTGGLLTADKAAFFPNARLLVSGAEADFWNSDERRGAAPEGMRLHFDLSRAVFAAYADRLERIADGAGVLPGITAHDLAGHTPGHTGLRIDSQGSTLLLWTDIVHLPGIQLAHAEVALEFDTDPDQARTTRQRTLDMAAADRLLVAGNHMDFPCFGHVTRHGDGFAWEPLVWAPFESGLSAGG